MQTHDDNVFVTRDRDLFYSQINGFPALIAGHFYDFYVKFDDPSCVVVEISFEKNRPKGGENLYLYPATPVGTVNISQTHSNEAEHHTR